MCYFKYQENLENVLADTYVEVDNDMVMRQISLTEDKMISSNIKDNHYHFRLCDQEIDISDGQYVLITEEEFNGIWSKEMEKYSTCAVERADSDRQAALFLLDGMKNSNASERNHALFRCS